MVETLQKNEIFELPLYEKSWNQELFWDQYWDEHHNKVNRQRQNMF